MARKKGKAIYYSKQESQIVGYFNNAVTKLAGLVAKYGNQSVNHDYTALI